LVTYAKAASAREKLERRLSMGATAASAIVALSIFASLSASPSATAKLLTGILSAIAAALASLDKLSAKAPSSALLSRSGELATLRYKLARKGKSALAAVGTKHAELIGSPPAADDKYWTGADPGGDESAGSIGTFAVRQTEYALARTDWRSAGSMTARSKFGRLCLFAACVLFAAFETNQAQAAPGSLDPSFSSDGRATVDFGTSYAGAEALAIGQDGSILVVGGVDQSGPDEQLAMARFTASGEPDTSFGSGDGAELFPYIAYGYGVALQEDGKIIVVTADEVSPGNSNWVVARFDPAGLPDASFGGGDGIVTTDFGLEAAAPGDVAVQPDGNIVVAGFKRVMGDPLRIVVARYTTDGSLDSGFGVGGTTTTRIGLSATASSLALASNGKIVVAGTAQLRDQDDFCVARFRSDGTLDVRFGGDGKVTTDLGGSTDRGSDVAIQQDGRIVVVGQASGTATKSPDFGIVRYLPRGVLDRTFSGDGKVRTDFKDEEDWAGAVAIQGNGKIVVGGYAYNNGWPDFALARYRVDGRLDLSFGRFGLRRTDFGGRDDYANDVVLQADGRIVAAGRVHGSSGYDAGVARYLRA
jgi:uncharacterized delta-60 repeat protein